MCTWTLFSHKLVPSAMAILQHGDANKSTNSCIFKHNLEQKTKLWCYLWFLPYLLFTLKRMAKGKVFTLTLNTKMCTNVKIFPSLFDMKECLFKQYRFVRVQERQGAPSFNQIKRDVQLTSDTIIAPSDYWQEMNIKQIPLVTMQHTNEPPCLCF